MADKQKIIDRVRKLFAVADPKNNASKGERDNAKKLAADLLRKNGILESDVFDKFKEAVGIKSKAPPPDKFHPTFKTYMIYRSFDIKSDELVAFFRKEDPNCGYCSHGLMILVATKMQIKYFSDALHKKFPNSQYFMANITGTEANGWMPADFNEWYKNNR